MSVKRIADDLNRLADGYRTPIETHLNHAPLVRWLEIHGWDSSTERTCLLVARQAALLAFIRHVFPNLELFPTPLDMFVSKSRLDTRIEDALETSVQFNFWGELHNALIPQPDRRRIGQFWTSELVADWMTAWLLQFNPRKIADVGCGSGNFLSQAAQTIRQSHLATRLYGYDISPLILNVALANLASHRLSLPYLTAHDYLDNLLPSDADAVICNPPYTRHHHIAPALKDKCQWFFKSRFHLDVSRQATLASYFLLKLIAEMPEGAHAAIILPMEVLDARYGNTTKRVLCRETSLSAMIHFAPEMNAFAKVDVGASILLFRKGAESDNRVKHITLRALPTTEQLLEVLDALDAPQPEFGSLIVQPQRELEQIPKWFSATSQKLALSVGERNGLVVPLKELAVVMRGIATGANEFFALPTSEVGRRSLRPYVVRTIQRNREIQDILLDDVRWQNLSDQGRRVWLLYLNGEPVAKHPGLQAYIAEGEACGFHQRSLVQTRKRWYMMEQRRVPPIFFTILTRGNPRFILNKADVRPLNMFSLIYPNRQVIENDCTKILWACLNSEFSLSRLHSVSRTYGGKTLKVEPRELDNLPVLNPLALSEATKQKFECLIADYESYQRTDIFLQEVNRLVGIALTIAAPLPSTAARPKQLELLEPSKRYGRRSICTKEKKQQ